MWWRKNIVILRTEHIGRIFIIAFIIIMALLLHFSLLDIFLNSKNSYDSIKEVLMWDLVLLPRFSIPILANIIQWLTSRLLKSLLNQTVGLPSQAISFWSSGLT